MAGKKLCEWTKVDLKAKREKYVRLVSSPRYYCAQCGRVAAEPKRLCKPTDLV